MDLVKRQDIPVIEQWSLGPLAYSPLVGWKIWLGAAIVVIVLKLANVQDWYVAVLIGVAAFIATYLYRIAYNKSVVLYMDDSGVWIARGLLPWNRGVYGVKWRDIESILFRQGFTHWIMRSYPVVVVERFTQQKEIRLDHVWHGDRAVTAMNEKLMAMTKGMAQ